MDSNPRFVTCRCQHCDGHIEFDASQFEIKGSAGNTLTGQTAPCPHCQMETILFVPVQVPKPEAKSQSTKRQGISVLQAGKTIVEVESFMTGKFERVVFKLVRIFAVFWAAVIVLGFVTCTVNYISTFFPAKSDAEPQSLLGHAVQSPALENLGIYLAGLFALFCALTIISFVLVLLAIERNTRKNEF